MINTFRSFLVEEEKTIYFTFGRMNPPTIGHEKLLNVLAAKSGNNPYRVFLSQSQDKSKNPLSYKDKVKFARKMFPRHARAIMLSPEVKTVFDAVTKLYNEGFKRVVMIVGSDRVPEFDVLLKKYNGKKGRHGLYNFEKITIISAGERDPDAEGIEGMSASKMRAAAKENDFTLFSQGIPKSLSNANTKQLYNTIRKAMGLKESTNFSSHIQLEPISEIRESYVTGELFSQGDTVIIKDTGKLAKVKYLGSNYVIVEDSGNQYRKWLDAIEKVELEQTNEETQDPDIGNRKGSQPAGYHTGLSKSTKIARDRQFKKQSKMDDDNPAAYKPAPGDKTSKTKPSKHTLRFKQMYGEDFVDAAKERIKKEKEADKRRHDMMMDRARIKAVQKKNKETT